MEAEVSSMNVRMDGFGIAARKVGWTDEDVFKLTRGTNMLRDALALVRGQAVIPCFCKVADRGTCRHVFPERRAPGRLQLHSIICFWTTALKQGWTHEDLTRVTRDERKLSQVLVAVRGQAVISTGNCLMLNLDALPDIPLGWDDALEIRLKDQLPHAVREQTFEFDASKVTLYLAEGQKGNKTILGRELCTELRVQRVFPASLLDWLIRDENRDFIIPESWKKHPVCFWGTIYHGRDRLYVRYLWWDGRRWCSAIRSLDEEWHVHSPAAVSASWGREPCRKKSPRTRSTSMPSLPSSTTWKSGRKTSSAAR